MIDTESGEITERGRGIIQACASYTEVSPSGRGVHIICQGETKSFKSNEVGVEVFCGRQYFTFTGHRYPGTPDDVAVIPEKVLNRLRATVESGRKRADGKPSTAPPPAMEGRAKVESALAYVSPDCGYNDWIAVGMAICGDLGPAAIDVFDTWSSRSAKYPGRHQLEQHWKSFPADAGAGPLFKRAMDAGWQPPRAPRRQKAAPPAPSSAPAPAVVAGEASQEPENAAQAGASARYADIEEGFWRPLLLKKDDKLVDCRENIYLMLRNHPDLAGVVWVDEFARRVVKRKPAPWDDPRRFVPETEWDDTEHLRLGLWLAQQERLTVRSENNLALAVNWAAQESRWHPVREYLDGLVWDGIERIDHWLTDFVGVHRSEYTALSGRWFLIGMVARILQPGCPMRSMLILEGEQWRGKSTVWRILGGKWFGDSAIDLNNKDSYQLIQGRWLYEIAELDAFSRADVTRIKNFISSPEDRFRAPYDRAPKDHPRSTVFAGTTNQDEYFKDPSGNTRYWPMRADDVDAINLEGLTAVRDQLFAEAVMAFRRGDRWHPTREEQERLFAPEQASREITDPWESLIYNYLSRSTFKRCTTMDILSECMKVEAGKIDGTRQMATRVGIAMKRIGWIKRRETDGSRGYYYARPDAWVAGPSNGGDRAPF